MELAQMELDKPFSELTDLGKLRLLWNTLVPDDSGNINRLVPDKATRLPGPAQCPWMPIPPQLMYSTNNTTFRL